MRRRVTVVALGVLTAVQLFVLPASAYGDQWSASLTVPPGSDGVSLVDNYQWNAISDITAGSGTTAVECSTFSASGPCAPNLPDGGIVTAILPVCATSTSTNCVASMSLGASTSAMVPSTYTSMVSGTTTPSDPALNIPSGSSAELWTNPLTNLGGTNSYATLVSVQFVVGAGKVVSATMSAAIYPYRETQGTYFAPFFAQTNEGLALEGGDIDCAYTTATTCGRLEDFPLSTQASLSIRVTNSVGGWFKGRLEGPTISETPFDADSNVITVSAGVVTVPTLSYVATTEEAASNPNVGTFFTDLGLPAPPIAAGAYVLTDSPEAFQALDAIRDAVDNTATGQMTVWNYGTLTPWTASAGQRTSCLDNDSQVDGIVTTNSMAYQPGAPSLQGGFFSYGVAGMHYNADGSVVLGAYNLDIRDSVAECLYGFTNAPISATVSVTENASDVENVATTTVQNKNGWLEVGAYGFNFSNPTISIKFSGTRARTKTSVMCVRGHVSKRITGTSARELGAPALARVGILEVIRQPLMSAELAGALARCISIADSASLPLRRAITDDEVVSP